MADDSAEFEASAATHVLGSAQVADVVESATMTADMPTNIIAAPETAALFLEPDDVTVALVCQCPKCGLMYSAEYDICAVDGAELEELVGVSTLQFPATSLDVESATEQIAPESVPGFDSGLEFGADAEAMKRLRDEQLGVADDHTIRGSVLDGRYFVEELIGEGGMGRVYRASQLSVGRTVAVKVLHRHFSDEQSIRERFNREARLVSGFNHANTVRLIDFGEAEGHLYMVMEFVEGVSLQKVVGRGPLNVSFALEVLRQVCGPLAEAHKADVVHRDLKPDNLFLTKGVDGRLQVKLLDFGVAHIDPATGDEAETHRELTKQGVVVGTPEYMAPEQARAETIRTTTDIYALGVIFYQMISGRLPFEGQTSMHTLFQLVTKPVPPLSTHIPNCPLPIVELAEELLRKEPEQRLPNVIQLARRVREVQLQLSLPPFGELGDGDVLEALNLILRDRTADTLNDESLKATEKSWAVPESSPQPEPRSKTPAKRTPKPKVKVPRPAPIAKPVPQPGPEPQSSAEIEVPASESQDLSHATALRAVVPDSGPTPVPKPAPMSASTLEPTAEVGQRQIRTHTRLNAEPTQTQERRQFVPPDVEVVGPDDNARLQRRLLTLTIVIFVGFTLVAIALAFFIAQDAA